MKHSSLMEFQNGYFEIPSMRKYWQMKLNLRKMYDKSGPYLERRLDYTRNNRYLVRFTATESFIAIGNGDDEIDIYKRKDLSYVGQLEGARHEDEYELHAFGSTLLTV